MSSGHPQRRLRRYRCRRLRLGGGALRFGPWARKSGANALRGSVVEWRIEQQRFVTRFVPARIAAQQVASLPVEGGLGCGKRTDRTAVRGEIDHAVAPCDGGDE